MASLSLPPPANGGVDSNTLPPALAASAAAKPDGLILPPPEIRTIVDKTASFVAKSPKPELFEEKIRAREKSDSRFAFLNKEDAYHAYYLHRLEAFRGGEVAEVKAEASKTGAADGGDELDDNDGRPPEPPALEYLVEQPPAMNAVDLDILRLTALFTARSGRRFTSELASRENRNYQFDFLRPSHSLFGYFNRLTEQYTKILIPSKEAQARLERRSGGADGERQDRRTTGRREVLKDVKSRVEWEKWESTRRKELEDAEEADRIAFAEIDWQDFVVVSTVEFTEADEAGLVELPPPMSISEVENMTIAQKKMAAMIMEGREDEVAENERERERGEEAEMEMEVEEDEELEPEGAEEAKLEKERRRVVEIRTADANAPMKIRKDYVPKARRPVAAAGPAMTTFGDQQVPVEDFANHVRIELLDPRWKEEKRISEANRSASNLLPGGTDVSASIRGLAAHRPDIFGTGADDDARRQAEAIATAQSKAREKVVWDGHTATKDAITSRFAGASLDEQIEALHRAKGLLGADETPKIGPSVPNASSAPSEPSGFISGATISGAPQPHQSNNAYFQPQNQFYTLSSQPPPQPYGLPIAGLPARPPVTNPGEALPLAQGQYASISQPSAQTGAGRPAEAGPEGEPIAKRQRVPKRTDGSFWPEEEWLLSHPDPISVSVQLPDYPAKPAWGCDGSEVRLDDIPLTLLVGTLRDRIAAKVGIPISKQKLSFNGRILANSGTLGGLNFEGGERIVVAVKDVKKR